MEPAQGGKTAQEACVPLPRAPLSVQRQEQTLLPVAEQGPWELTEAGDVRASSPGGPAAHLEEDSLGMRVGGGGDGTSVSAPPGNTC